MGNDVIQVKGINSLFIGWVRAEKRNQPELPGMNDRSGRLLIAGEGGLRASCEPGCEAKWQEDGKTNGRAGMRDGREQGKLQGAIRVPSGR